ncbi:MAG: pro-sigmaK processing inhibitor BofA family protein [Bacilli bacterium]|nr:pro-sigmaK processing inhibitor BofA family protein [Bacilli bacterium]MDD4809089.1 pro-sigmaK processing inhibitor BofA family protein [Bacilli bacterium]
MDKMLKKILKFGKKIILSAFFIYGYNLIMAPLNLVIPINVVTVLAVTIFGIPMLLSLIIILLIVF